MNSCGDFILSVLFFSLSLVVEFAFSLFCSIVSNTTHYIIYRTFLFDFLFLLFTYFVEKKKQKLE